MKRIILLLSLLIPMASFADNVSVRTAQAAAESFFATGGTKSSNVSLVWSGNTTGVKAAAQSPSFYVFNRAGGGFVVISGDDAISPVIAYSMKNSFVVEGMPDNIRYWFRCIDGAVERVRNEGKGQDASVQKAWSELKAGTSLNATTILQYSTAQWGQGSPFNDDCPEYEGEKCVTGCVATAMAIVMRYFGHPAKGSGTLPGYTTYSNSISIPSVTLGDTYNWAEMPLEYDEATSTQNKEVARLMYHCGVAVEMDYDPSGSAASEYHIPELLTLHFGYDAAARYGAPGIRTSEQWIEVIKKNLKEVGPTLYTGSDSSQGGHAFVLDGYDSNDFVSVNWGWNGYANGFYSIKTLDPKGYTFCKDQSALLNLKPDEGGTAVYGLVAECYESDDKGLSVSDTTLKVTEKFSVTYEGAVTNYGYGKFEGYLAIGLESSEGELKEIVSSKKSLSIKSGYLVYVEETDSWTGCSISSLAQTGDRLRLYSKGKDENDWSAVPYREDDEGMVYMVTITVKDPEIDKNTSVEFDKQTGILTFKTISGAEASLKDSDGKDVTKGLSVADGVIKIDKNKTGTGEFTLTISKKEDSKVMKLKF